MSAKRFLSQYLSAHLIGMRCQSLNLKMKFHSNQLSRIAIKTSQECCTIFFQTRRTYVQVQRRWTMEIEKIVQNKAKKSLFPKENKQKSQSRIFSFERFSFHLAGEIRAVVVVLCIQFILRFSLHQEFQSITLQNSRTSTYSPLLNLVLRPCCCRKWNSSQEEILHVV